MVTSGVMATVSITLGGVMVGMIVKITLMKPAVTPVSQSPVGHPGILYNIDRVQSF